MEKMPSPDKQKEIKDSRLKSDRELVMGGAKFKEGNRLELTKEQMEAAKKEMEAEKGKTENFEIKGLEELKKQSLEAGASSEDIKALDAKLEEARDGGEAYIAKKENEYREARDKERELAKSMAEGGAFYEKAKKRANRDAIIGAAVMGAGIVGGVVAFPLGSVFLLKAGFGLIVGGAPIIMGSIAKIQNWFEKRKIKKEISQAKEKGEEAKEALKIVK